MGDGPSVMGEGVVRSVCVGLRVDLCVGEGLCILRVSGRMVRVLGLARSVWVSVL